MLQLIRHGNTIANWVVGEVGLATPDGPFLLQAYGEEAKRLLELIRDTTVVRDDPTVKPMCYKTIEDILKQITYKDWVFKLGWNPGVIWIQVQFVRGVSQFSAGVPEYGRKWIVSEHATKSEIVQTALKAVLTAEEHEAREAFSYQGLNVFNPHIDIGALGRASTFRECRDSVRVNAITGEDK